MKQKELSVWLIAIDLLFAACCAILAYPIAPELWKEVAGAYPEFGPLYPVCLGFTEVTAIPVFASAYLAWRIFADIGRDNSFCEANALRLRAISRLALADTGAYIAGALVLFFRNLLHPGLRAAAFAVIFAGLCITVVCAALSHLTRKAAQLKRDSDLTI